MQRLARPRVFKFSLLQLHYCVKAAEFRSVTRAGRAINISQPAITAAIQHMERVLGVQIFLREHARGLSVTAEGEIVLRAARTVLESATELTVLAATHGLERGVGSASGPIAPVLGAEEESHASLAHAIRLLTKLQHAPSDRVAGGAIMVGLPTTVANVLAVPLLKAVTGRRPNLFLHLVEAHTAFLRGWVSSGELDLAILFDDAALAGVEMEPLLVESLYLISPPGSGAQLTVALADAARLPLFMPSRSHGMRKLMEAQVHAIRRRCRRACTHQAGGAGWIGPYGSVIGRRPRGSRPRYIAGPSDYGPGY